MADDLVENYMKVEVEKERIQKINCINKAILCKELSLITLVEKLGPYLTNPDVGERCEGTQLLAALLHRLMSFKLLDKEVTILVEFFCDRLKDHFSIIPHVVSGLLALVSYQDLPEGLAIKMVQAIFKEIHIQSLLQADRHNIYTLFSVLLNKKMTELQKLGADFVFGFIQAMDGEKDPRNLLVCFNLVQIIIRNFPITLFAEDLFEVTSCYFPIDFTPPPNDPNAITREQLILALRKCLAATTVFAPFCIPLLIEKLSSDVVYAKKDALLTLAACANVYDARFLTEYVDSLWNHIKKEVFTTADQSIEVSCLEAIKSVVRSISIAEEQNHAGTLKDVLTSVINDCKDNLLKPDHKLMKTSASILQNVAMASDMACACIADQVFPILLQQFALHKQVSNQKSILDAMLGFLQVAKDFMNKDTSAILKSYKDKLLGLFFSLLVNHNPLHRSSGVAGLVAMVSSELLDEQEVLSFLDHLVLLILDDKEKIVRHEAKLALAYLSSQFPAVVRSRVVVQLTERLSKKDDCNSMETDNEANKVPESTHITHEYLVTTLATLCTSEENVKCIVPSLVDKLTTLSESTSTNNERNVACVIDSLQNIFDGCLKSSLKVLDYYKDVIYLRVLNLAILNSLGKEECSFTPTILEKFCKLLRSISSKLSESSSELIVTTVGEIFLDGKLDLGNHPDVLNRPKFDVLNASSPWQQTQLVMFLTAILCNVSKKVVISRLRELCSRLLTLTTECCHRRTNIEASKCLAGLLNRIQDDNQIEEETQKCLRTLDASLEVDRDKDEKWRATILLIWITKALLIRAYNLGIKLLEKLLGLFCDPVISQCAADGFYVIMSTSDDVMSNSSCANIKLMYKQRIFIQVSPMLTKLFHSSDKESKHLYLCALSHILHWLPKQVLLSEIPTLIPLLVQSLACEETNLQLSTLETFYSLTHDVPKIISQYVTSLVPRYLHLAQNAPSLKIRCMSLKCLGVLTVLPHHQVYPSKNQVIRSLAKCLDDHKRLVRKEAVQCRNEWFFLGSVAE